MNPADFLKRFNDALTEAGVGKLKGVRISEGRSSWDLFAVTETEWGRQAIYDALRKPGVVGTLKRWNSGELRVHVRAPSWRAPVPIALLNDGDFYVVTRSVEEDEHESPAPSPSFEAWFEGLIGAPPPLNIAVELQRNNLFVSTNALTKETSGMPHVLRVDDLDAYTAVAFAGYGSNSYALYVSRVLERTQMFLRLPWGGAYMDPEKFRPRLLEDLSEANELFEMAAKQWLPMYLNNNMGDWYFAGDSGDRSSAPEPIRSLREVRNYVVRAKV